MCWPLPERSICRIYQALNNVISAINPWFGRPLYCVSDQSSQYLHSMRLCYCAVIISSLSTISLKCCEKALNDNRHIASVAKPFFIAKGSPQVRGLRPRPACFNVIHSSDRTQYRCGAQVFPWEYPDKILAWWGRCLKGQWHEFFFVSKSLNRAPFFKKSSSWDPT